MKVRELVALLLLEDQERIVVVNVEEWYPEPIESIEDCWNDPTRLLLREK